MDVSTRAVLTAVLGAVVAGSAVLHPTVVTVVAVLLALAVAYGWPRLLDLPVPLGAFVVVALGGAGGAVVVGVTSGEPSLRDLPVVVALAVLLTFVNEMARQDGRARLVDSVSGTVTGVLVAAAGSGWIAADRTVAGPGLVVAGAVALAVGAAVSAVPLGGWVAVLVTTAAAVIGGGAAAAVMPRIDPVTGVVLGVAVGLLVAVLHSLLEHVPALERRSAAVAGLVLPVSVSGIVVYVIGRVMLG